MKYTGIALAVILVLGTAIPAFADLRGPTADHIKWLQKQAKNVGDLCQYAETKMEKKSCYDTAKKIKSDGFYTNIMKQYQKKIDDIVKKYEKEFQKKTLKKTSKMHYE